MTIKGTDKSTLEGAPKDALSDLHEDAQEGAFEVALKGAIEVVLELVVLEYLWLHLFMQPLMHKCVQNGSSTGGTDAALKGALDDGFNVALEGAL